MKVKKNDTYLASIKSQLSFESMKKFLKKYPQTAAMITSYLSVRSRLWPVITHEFLGHHCLGMKPFYRDIQFEVGVITPSIFNNFNWTDISLGKVTLNRTIQKVISPNSIAYYMPTSYMPRKLISRYVHPSIGLAWVFLAGPLVDVMIQPALCAAFLQYSDFLLNSDTDYLRPIAVGLATGFGLRTISAFSYYGSTFKLTKVQLVRQAKSGHDHALICKELFHYKQIKPRTTLFAVGGILSLMTALSFKAGLAMSNQLNDEAESYDSGDISFQK